MLGVLVLFHLQFDPRINQTGPLASSFPRPTAPAYFAAALQGACSGTVMLKG